MTDDIAGSFDGAVVVFGSSGECALNDDLLFISTPVRADSETSVVADFCAMSDTGSVEVLLVGSASATLST